VKPHDPAMRDDAEDNDDVSDTTRNPPAGSKNYSTSDGLGRLEAELKHLIQVERPRVVETVAWAGGNGDCSENGDSIHGKRRLRAIDARVHLLARPLEIAEVADPALRPDPQRAFFCATVTYARADGAERTLTIVGADEVDPETQRVSWISPIGRPHEGTGRRRGDPAHARGRRAGRVGVAALSDDASAALRTEPRRYPSLAPSRSRGERKRGSKGPCSASRLGYALPSATATSGGDDADQR
jgi:transcription elongation factor GreB